MGESGESGLRGVGDVGAAGVVGMFWIRRVWDWYLVVGSDLGWKGRIWRGKDSSGRVQDVRPPAKWVPNADKERASEEGEYC